MDEVAAGPVGAEADTVVGPAEVCLVLGMPVDRPQLVLAVGKLALFPVLAAPVLLERPAQFCLVARAAAAAAAAAACRRRLGAGR